MPPGTPFLLARPGVGARPAWCSRREMSYVQLEIGVAALVQRPLTAIVVLIEAV
jgi:hypothetical protein